MRMKYAFQQMAVAVSPLIAAAGKLLHSEVFEKDSVVLVSLVIVSKMLSVRRGTRTSEDANRVFSQNPGNTREIHFD